MSVPRTIKASAAKVKGLRARFGLSREEVAISCGVTAQTVWLWERGERVPSGAADKLLDQMIAERELTPEKDGAQ